MSYDEKTAELDANIVRVDFRREAKSKADPSAFSRIFSPTAEAAKYPNASRWEWLSEIDLRSPWVLRLLAVVFVLLLSMLVL